MKKKLASLNGTQKWIYFLILFQAIILGWMLVVTVASATGDGMFYNIEQPIPVVDVHQESAVLEITRQAAWAMDGECNYEIECTRFVTQLGGGSCPIEAGEKTFQFALVIPEEAVGPCQFRGTVKYTPFGPFGPHFTEDWVSEEFMP